MPKKSAYAGLCVLDLTQFLAGPYCTTILADLGADVIKIERPDRPVGAGPYVKGERIYTLATERGKKSITLNLKDEKDKEILLRLVAKADVLMENFRPGVMAKLGLSYEQVCKHKPDIIYTSISGFGQTGPYSKKGALDTVIQAMSGLMSLTGEAGGRPMKAGTSIGDILTGLYATVGTLAALAYREQTGQGQYVDVAMLDAVFASLEVSVTNYCLTGQVPTRIGNRHQIAAPFQPFRTKDGELVITANRNANFAALCHALGRDELLSDKRFTNTTSRKLNEDALEAELEKTTRKLTMEEIEALLEPAGVPTGRINSVDKIVADPQIAAREMLVELQHPLVGPYKVAGSPLKLSKTQPGNSQPAPLLGQHTAEVLSTMLNMSKVELEQLQNRHKALLLAADTKV